MRGNRRIDDALSLTMIIAKREKEKQIHGEDTGHTEIFSIQGERSRQPRNRHLEVRRLTPPSFYKYHLLICGRLTDAL